MAVCHQLENDAIPFIFYLDYYNDQKNKQYLDELKKNAKAKRFYSKYQKEIEYMLQCGKYSMIPYPFRENYYLMDIDIDFDHTLSMHYYLMNDKKLYLPQGWREIDCKNYIRDMLIEQDEQSPHCYFDKIHKVNKTDVFLDIGSAEGMTALSVVDAAKKIYLFECDSQWNDALAATFAPYRNKVVFVNKMVGASIGEEMTTIDKMFSDNNEDLFIKIDIEGGEADFLLGAQNVLKNNNVKLSICTYHKKNDVEDFRTFFNNLGYKTELTNGYIFAWWDRAAFVKGILKASKYYYDEQ